jgi:hypothetical protein
VCGGACGGINSTVKTAYEHLSDIFHLIADYSLGYYCAGHVLSGVGD